MRFFTARRLALAALFPVLACLSVIPGCSQQGEGERCGDAYGTANSDDCGSGLTCTLGKDLLNGDGEAHRCCYAGRKPTDARCIRSTGSSTAGAGGASGSSAGGGAGDNASGGAVAGGGASGSSTGVDAGSAGVVTEAGAGGG